MRYLLAMLTAVALLMPSAAFAEDVIDHKPFDEILDTYVNKQGMVAYGKLEKNKADLEKFNAYVSAIEKAKIDGEKHSKKSASPSTSTPTTPLLSRPCSRTSTPTSRASWTSKASSTTPSTRSLARRCP